MAPASEKRESPEKLETRCPRLGGTVPFRYCLAPGEPTPCFKILDCWWETFDVVSYLKERLPEETFDRLSKGLDKPNRLNAILEMVERLKGTERG